MLNFLKNIFLTFATMIFSITVFANNNDEISYYKSNCCYMNESCCCKVPYCFNPCYCKKKNEFLIHGDFLYWRASLSGLEGAFGNTSLVTSQIPLFTFRTLVQTDVEPKFKWRPGFRVGANLLVHCLDIEADWTHYNGLGRLTNGDQFGKWKVRYDTIDLTFGYKFYPCSRLCIKPDIGLRGAEIRQHLNSHLITVQFNPADDPALTTPLTDMNDSERFYGLGPQAGVEADWYIGRLFSLYFSVDAVGYYGHVSGKYFDTDLFSSLSVENINNVEKKHCFNNLSTDAAIGIRFDKYFCTCNCNTHVMFKLGLEQHRLYELSYLGTDGSLSIDGGFFEAGIGLLF